jgi:hypothetical protein
MRGSIVLPIVAMVVLVVAAHGRADVQVSGKTYTESSDKPVDKVKIQAYQHGKSSPVGEPGFSNDGGKYTLRLTAVNKFDVVYFHPDPNYVEQVLPARDGFDGSDNNRYPNQDVTFFTPKQFIDKFGKAAFQTHIQRLRNILPKEHPRQDKLKSLAEKD